MNKKDELLYTVWSLVMVREPVTSVKKKSKKLATELFSSFLSFFDDSCRIEGTARRFSRNRRSSGGGQSAGVSVACARFHVVK